MAWLGEGLSTLRGQITSVANFTKEVLSDGKEDDESDVSGLGAAQRNIRELEEICAAKDLEISTLRRRNDHLESVHGDRGGPSQDPGKGAEAQGHLEYLSTESWHQHELRAGGGGGRDGGARGREKEAPKDFVLVPEEKEVTLMGRLDRLEAENRLLRSTCCEYEEQVAELLDQRTKYASCSSEESAADLAAQPPQEDSAAAATTIREQLQAAECRVADLEAELQSVCRELWERDSGDASAGGAVMSLDQESNAMSQLPALGKEQEHRAGDVSVDLGKIADKKLQEHIRGLINALELENQRLKLRNAALEVTATNAGGIDSDIGYKVDHFTGNPVDSQKHATVDDIDVLQSRSRDGASDAALRTEVDDLSAAKQCLMVELEAMATLLQDLEAKNFGLQEENVNLSTGLEELDQQNQIVIDQLLETKKAVQKENRNLKQETAELKLKLEVSSAQSHISDVESKKKECAEIGTETADLHRENIDDYKKQYDDELYTKIIQLVTFELPKEFRNRNNDETDSVGLVQEIVKICEESKWKKDTLERKISECMKEVRDTQSVVNEKDSMIAGLEKEMELLRGHVKALVEQVTSDQNDGDGLAMIPENSEETELLEQRLALLEGQLQQAIVDKEKLIAEVEVMRNENVASTDKLSAEQALVIDIQNKYTLALNDRTVLETENTSLKERIVSSAAASSRVDDLEKECLRWQESANICHEQLIEAGECKRDLERDVATLRCQLQEVQGELNIIKDNAQTSQETIRHYLKLEKDVHGWDNICQEMVNAQNALRKEVAGLENAALVMSRKLDESVEAQQLAESKCFTLQETLGNHESMVMDDQKYKEQLNTIKQVQKDLEDQWHQLCSELSNKNREIENSHMIIITLEEKVKNLVASKAAERSEADKNAEEATLREQGAMEHEVHKWKTMATAAERQLDEALSAKEELEAECRRLFSIETKVHNQEHLEREVVQLTEVSRTTEARLREALEAKDELEGNLNRLKASLEDQKNLEQEATEWREKSKATEVQLQDALSTSEKLTVEATKFKEVEHECLKSRGIISVLQHQLNSLVSSNNELKSQMEVSQAQLQRLHRADDEIAQYKKKVQVMESQLKESVTQKLEVEGKDKKMEVSPKSSGMEKMDEEKPLDISSDSKIGTHISSTSAKIEEQLENTKQDRHKMLASFDEKIQEISLLKSENSRLQEIISEKKHVSSLLQGENNETFTQIQFQSSEASVMAKETIANLSKIITDKDLEIQALTKKTDTLTSCLQEANLVKPVEETNAEREALLHELQRLGSERDELIGAVQIKHGESVQYHGEIQRLSGLLNQELSRSEQIRLQYNGLVQKYEENQMALVNSQKELIAVKQRLDKLEHSARKHELFQENMKQVESQLDDPESMKSKDEVIAMKTELAKELGHELKTREKEIDLLKLEIVELRSVGNVSDGSQVRGRQLPEGRRSLVEELQAERTQLLNSLSQETSRNKHLQNELQEHREKESSLLRELDRLREHLVAVEEGYTQESLHMEQTVSELQGKLAAADDRIKNCSTAYTSANIRANQHVESLQGQTRLIGQQRDDMQAKLGAAEDQVQKHAAALRNLQGVLEQFQRDKEMDILSVTSRLQKQVHGAEARNAELCAEIASLQAQLAEAKEGLSAATRLGEQLDKKAQTIAALKEEVQRLSEQLNSAESREKSASLNSEGKVDRYLVKNLLIGYLVAPAHTKPQALRIVSTVLDFNHDERCRVGLEPGAQPGGSWFKSLMHPGNPSTGNQSLAEAFVRFLESESRPQPQLRLLPSIQDAPQREAKSTDSPMQDSRSPLLLTEVQLPTFTQFPVARSSSSILKDVLKDS